MVLLSPPEALAGDALRGWTSERSTRPFAGAPSCTLALESRRGGSRGGGSGVLSSLFQAAGVRRWRVVLRVAGNASAEADGRAGGDAGATEVWCLARGKDRSEIERDWAAVHVAAHGTPGEGRAAAACLLEMLRSNFPAAALAQPGAWHAPGGAPAPAPHHHRLGAGAGAGAGAEKHHQPPEGGGATLPTTSPAAHSSAAAAAAPAPAPAAPASTGSSAPHDMSAVRSPAPVLDEDDEDLLPPNVVHGASAAPASASAPAPAPASAAASAAAAAAPNGLPPRAVSRAGTGTATPVPATATTAAAAAAAAAAATAAAAPSEPDTIPLDLAPEDIHIGAFIGDGVYSEVFKGSCFLAENHQLLTSEGFMFYEQAEERLARDDDLGPLLFAGYDEASRSIVYERPEVQLGGGRLVVNEPTDDDERLVEFTDHVERERWGQPDPYGRSDTAIAASNLAIAAAEAWKAANPDDEAVDPDDFHLHPRDEDDVAPSGDSGAAAAAAAASSEGISNHLSIVVTQGHEMYVRIARGHVHRRGYVQPNQPWGRYPEFDKHMALSLASTGRKTILKFLGFASGGVDVGNAPIAELPFVRVLNLDTDDQIIAFLEVYGFWLGGGSLDFTPGGNPRVTFAQKKKEAKDIGYLRKRFATLGFVVDTDYIISQHSDGSTVLAILDPRWNGYFFGQYGHKYQPGRERLAAEAAAPAAEETGTEPSALRVGCCMPPRGFERAPNAGGAGATRGRRPSGPRPAPAPGMRPPPRTVSVAAFKPRRNAWALDLGDRPLLVSSGAQLGAHVQAALAVKFALLSADSHKSKSTRALFTKRRDDVIELFRETAAPDPASVQVSLADLLAEHQEWRDAKTTVLKELTRTLEAQHERDAAVFEDARRAGERNTAGAGESPPPLDDEGIPSAKWFWWWVWKLRKEHVRAILRGLRFADGKQSVADQTPNGGTVFTSSMRFRDELVHLLLHAGYSPYFCLAARAGEHRGYPDGRNTPAVANHDHWRVHYADSERFVTPNLSKLAGDTVDFVPSRVADGPSARSGKTWCATMPSGFVIVRRARRDAAGRVTFASRATVQKNCYGTPVAVKKFKNKGFDAAVLAEVRKEVRIMKSIRHPNLLLFLGACTQPGSLMIVTELMDMCFHDLTSHVRKDAPHLDAFTKLRILRDAAKGLSWLHSLSPAIIHRDLKPENLLVDAALKTVKVADFGLSLVRDHSPQSLEEMKKIRGSPAFMSPEALLGRELTTAADVYSFGMIAWELMTEWSPYENLSIESFDQLIEEICVRGTREIIPHTVAPLVADLIQLCWAGDPESRPSFLEILARFDRCLCAVAIPDSEGCRMWKLSFTQDGILLLQVPWTAFLAALDYYVSTPPSAKLVQALKLMLVKSSDREAVSMDRFGALLQWFGPMERQDSDDESFLSRAQELFTKRWFHGDISIEDAETRLTDHRPGVFLVRMSGSTPGRYALDMVRLVNGHREIAHFRISREPGGYTIELDGVKHVFPSLADLVKFPPLKLSDPCSGSGYYALSRVKQKDLGYVNR